MKAKIGRPKLEITRCVLIGARFTAAEAQQIESAVGRLPQGKSEWIREVLLDAAEKIGELPSALPTPPIVALALPQDEDTFLD